MAALSLAFAAAVASAAAPAAAPPPAQLDISAAVVADDGKAVKALVARGADPDALIGREGEEKEPALLYAIHNWRWDAADALLDAGAEVNLRSKSGEPILKMLAAVPDQSTLSIERQVALIRKLGGLGRQADKEAVDFQGRTALMSAASNCRGKGEVVTALTRFPVVMRITAQDFKGYSALMEAARSGKRECIGPLGNGATLELKDIKGDTALLIAVKNRMRESVEALLAKGAFIDARNTEGRTPLIEAVRAGDLGLVKLLLERGASADAKDGAGRTAADWARSTGSKDLLALLPRAADEPVAASSAVDTPAYKLPERPDDHAVVVGIERYAGLPRAEHAVRDAKAVRDHLLALGFPPRNIVFLTDDQAGFTDIKKSVEGWLPKRVTETSTVLFYFSGHGAPDLKTGQAFLVPSRGDPEYLEDTAYPLKMLYARLEALRARRVVVMLDSCFSGAGGRSVLPKGTRPLVMKLRRAEPAGKLVVMSAAAAEQVSGTIEEEGHGAFTYYLLKGLNGAAAGPDGAVTVKGLYDYLSPKVQDAARLRNRDQEPQLLSGSPDGTATRLR